MIQDIGEHSFDNAYAPCEAGPSSLVLCYADGGVLLRDGGRLELPHAAELGICCDELRFLFAVDGEPLYLGAPARVPEGFSCRPISWTRQEGPAELVLAVNAGAQLARWYEANRYCGRCGHAMEHAPISRELVCPECANIVYPKIAPGIIVGVVDPVAEKIVLTTYAGRPNARPALIAGFTEVGESLEQTVAREVREEVGLAVKNLRYYASQPWPFSDSLLAGFFCEVDGSRELAVDHGELKQAAWVAPADVPKRADDRISMTGEMMKLFRERGSAVLADGVRWEGER